MFCFRVRNHLIPYIEKALDEPKMKAIEKHLQKCSSCSEELSLLRMASSAFRNSRMPVQEPMHDLWGRIERQISEPAPAVYRFPGRAMKLAGALVAAVAIVFGVAVFSGHSPSNPAPRTLTEHAVKPKSEHIARVPDALGGSTTTQQSENQWLNPPTPKFPPHRRVVLAQAGPTVRRPVDVLVRVKETASTENVASGNPSDTGRSYVIASGDTGSGRPEISPDIKLGASSVGAARTGELFTLKSESASPTADSALEGLTLSSPPGPAGPSGSSVIASGGFYDGLTYPSVNTFGYGSTYPSSFGGQKQQSTAAVLANRRIASARVAHVFPVTSVDMLNLIDEDARNSAVFGY